MKKKKIAWKSVSVPETVIKEIQLIIDTTKLYTNPSDFVRDAIRRRIEDIERVTAYKSENVIVIDELIKDFKTDIKKGRKRKKI